MENKYLCPVCGQHRFPDRGDQANICPHCGWQHDIVSESEPDKVTGPNHLSLNDYKTRYEAYIQLDPNYHWRRDGYPEVQ